MEVSKEEYSTHLQVNTWKTSNPVSLVTFMIDLWGILNFPRDKRLSKTETKVMAAAILAYNEGHSKYLSSRFKSIVKAIARTQSTSTTKKYLDDLLQKGWLKSLDKETKEFEILEFFKDLRVDKYELVAQIVARHEVNG